jgi:hypothetical protein
MSKKWHLLDLWGMWGPASDPGNTGFVYRAANELDLNIHGSPYRDYQVNDAVDVVATIPATDGIFTSGTSLGGNNNPLIALYARLRGITRLFDGLFTFQASWWGYHSQIPSNVKFAHLLYSTNPLNMRLGEYIYSVEDASKTNFYKEDTLLLHPGDANIPSQDKFLRNMKTIMDHTP